MPQTQTPFNYSTSCSSFGALHYDLEHAMGSNPKCLHSEHTIHCEFDFKKLNWINAISLSLLGVLDLS